MFYPRQEIFWRYQVFHHKIYLFKVTRHCLCFISNLFEPPNDKTNNVVVRPAKTQIRLGIRPVWSESSLSAWRKLGSLATHWAQSEDSDQTGRMPRLIWVFAGRTVILLVLSRGGSFHLRWTHAFKYCYYHHTPWEDLKTYLPFDVTNFNFVWFYYKAHELCLMSNHTRNKAKQLPVVYFQKKYIVPCCFPPYYKCISMRFKICWYFFFVFNQLKLTNSVKFRMLILPLW